MPTPIYSINVRGREISGNHRCKDQVEAQSIYDQLSAAVKSPEEFFEIMLGTTKTMARKDNIAGFSMSVHMEETPEERKARAIARIESDIGYETGQCETKLAYANSAGGLIGGY
jgi:HJR/Mrr/RecB family endonuclease